MKVLVDATIVTPQSAHTSITIWTLRYLRAIPQAERQEYTLLIVDSAREFFRRNLPDFAVLVFRPTFHDYLRVPTLALRACVKWLDSVRMERLINPCHFDVYFSPNHWPIYGHLALNCKQAMVVHDLKELKIWRHDHWVSAVQSLFQSCKRRRQFMGNEALVACSKFTKQDLLTFYPEMSAEKIHVVYNCVPVAAASVCPTGFSAPRPYILFVNTLQRYKNVATLVRAFILLKERIGADLVVVGKPTDYWQQEVYPLIVAAGIEQRVQRLTGLSDEELRYLYEHAALFVTPSLREGFGYTPVEAAIYHCPVVSTIQESLPDVLGERVSYYYPAVDEQALADKIAAVLAHRPSPEQLADTAAYFQKIYAPEVQERAIHEILTGLCGA
jgi:glycosyltransferase involved in cell wall biosynthesis